MIDNVLQFGQGLLELVYPPAKGLREWELWLAENKPEFHRLIAYGSPNPGYADTINLDINIDPYTIRCKDGSYIRTYLYRGRDRSVDSRAARFRLNSLLNSIYNEFDEGWAIYGTLDRYRSTVYMDEQHPDAASWMVGEERRCEFEQFAFYQSDTYVSLVYKAPRNAKKKRSKTFEDANELREWLDAAYQTFVKRCEAYVQSYEMNYDVTPLGQRLVETPQGEVLVDDQRSLFYRIASGKRQLVAATTTGSIADQLAPGTIVHRDRVVRVGSTLMQPIAVVDTPSHSTPDILDGLDAVTGEFIASWRFISEDRDRVKREIKHTRGVAGQRKIPLMNQIFPAQSGAMPDLDAAYMEHDAEQANGINSDKSGRFGYFSLVVNAMTQIDPSEDEDAARQRLSGIASEIIGVLQARHFIVADDYGYEVELVRSVLPGQHYDNVIRPMLDTRPFADFLPTTHFWRGHEKYDARDEFFANMPPLAVLHGPGRGIFNLIHSFPQRGSNMLFLGDPRTGKSSFAALLANRFRKFSKMLRRGAAVIAIDKGYSHWVAVLASVWRTGKAPAFIELSPDTKRGYALFHDIGHVDERGEMQENKIGFNRCLSRLLLMVRENGMDPIANKRDLFNALRNFRSVKRELRTMSSFLSVNGMTTGLVDCLRFYARDGAAGNLFEGTEPLTLDNDFTVIELDPISGNEALKKVALFVTMGEIDKLADGSRPICLVTEEAWTFAADPELDDWFIRFLKDKPKQGLSAFIITHNLADLDRSRNPRAYIDACATKVLFPSESLLSKENMRRLESLNVSEERLRRFARNTGKNVALILQGENQAEVAIPFGPVTRATCALTSAEDRSRVQEIIRVAGDDWYPELIRQVAGERTGEGWRQHAYYWPPDEPGTRIAAAPEHHTPHPSDPFFDEEIERVS